MYGKSILLHIIIILIYYATLGSYKIPFSFNKQYKVFLYFLNRDVYSISTKLWAICEDEIKAIS